MAELIAPGYGHKYYYRAPDRGRLHAAQEQVVGGFGMRDSLGGGLDPQGWQAGYQATLQSPGSQPVREGYTKQQVLASYVHLHFGSCPALAASLVDTCRKVCCHSLNILSPLRLSVWKSAAPGSLRHCSGGQAAICQSRAMLQTFLRHEPVAVCCLLGEQAVLRPC